MTKILSLLRAHNELVQAIKSVPGDISISAAEPIVTAFGNYIEAIRAEVQSERKLQTHMEDLQAELDEAALPDSAPRKLTIANDPKPATLIIEGEIIN